MGIIGGTLGYQILRRIGRNGTAGSMDGTAHKARGKLETCFGPGIWKQIEGRTVIDFGCGRGHEVVEMARRGARFVTGLDIQEHFLAEWRAEARQAGTSGTCEFVARTDKVADVIVSLDAFEHFGDPADILVQMHRLLAPGGHVVISFGPTWYHPLGGHLFSVFPWAHLIFTEPSLIRWRSDFKKDGATRFSEVAGGLNQMTIRRFTTIVDQSPLEFSRLELVAIRQLAPLANRWTREWTTSVVRATLNSRDH